MALNERADSVDSATPIMPTNSRLSSLCRRRQEMKISKMEIPFILKNSLFSFYQGIGAQHDVECVCTYKIRCFMSAQNHSRFSSSIAEMKKTWNACLVKFKRRHKNVEYIFFTLEFSTYAQDQHSSLNTCDMFGELKYPPLEVGKSVASWCHCVTNLSRNYLAWMELNWSSVVWPSWFYMTKYLLTKA